MPDLAALAALHGRVVVAERAAAREDVLADVERVALLCPLRQLDGADLLTLLGAVDRAARVRSAIDRAREEWWRREEQRLHRLHLAALDARTAGATAPPRLQEVTR